MSAWWRNSNLSKAIEDDLSAAKVTIYDAEFLLATDLQSTSGWLPSMFLKKVRDPLMLAAAAAGVQPLCADNANLYVDDLVTMLNGGACTSQGDLANLTDDDMEFMQLRPSQLRRVKALVKLARESGSYAPLRRAVTPCKRLQESVKPTSSWGGTLLVCGDCGHAVGSHSELEPIADIQVHLEALKSNGARYDAAVIRHAVRAFAERPGPRATGCALAELVLMHARVAPRNTFDKVLVEMRDALQQTMALVDPCDPLADIIAALSSAIVTPRQFARPSSGGGTEPRTHLHMHMEMEVGETRDDDGDNGVISAANWNMNQNANQRTKENEGSATSKIVAGSGDSQTPWFWRGAWRTASHLREVAIAAVKPKQKSLNADIKNLLLCHQGYLEEVLKWNDPFATFVVVKLAHLHCIPGENPDESAVVILDDAQLQRFASAMIRTIERALAGPLTGGAQTTLGAFDAGSVAAETFPHSSTLFDAVCIGFDVLYAQIRASNPGHSGRMQFLKDKTPTLDDMLRQAQAASQRLNASRLGLFQTSWVSPDGSPIAANIAKELLEGEKQPSKADLEVICGSAASQVRFEDVLEPLLDAWTRYHTLALTPMQRDLDESYTQVLHRLTRLPWTQQHVAAVIAKCPTVEIAMDSLARHFIAVPEPDTLLSEGDREWVWNKLHSGPSAMPLLSRVLVVIERTGLLANTAIAFETLAGLLSNSFPVDAPFGPNRTYSSYAYLILLRSIDAASPASTPQYLAAAGPPILLCQDSIVGLKVLRRLTEKLPAASPSSDISFEVVTLCDALVAALGRTALPAVKMQLWQAGVNLLEHCAVRTEKVAEWCRGLNPGYSAVEDASGADISTKLLLRIIKVYRKWWALEIDVLSKVDAQLDVALVAAALRRSGVDRDGEAAELWGILTAKDGSLFVRSCFEVARQHANLEAMLTDTIFNMLASKACRKVTLDFMLGLGNAVLWPERVVARVACICGEFEKASAEAAEALLAQHHTQRPFDAIAGPVLHLRDAVRAFGATPAKRSAVETFIDFSINAGVALCFSARAALAKMAATDATALAKVQQASKASDFSECLHHVAEAFSCATEALRHQGGAIPDGVTDMARDWKAVLVSCTRHSSVPPPFVNEFFAALNDGSADVADSLAALLCELQEAAPSWGRHYRDLSDRCWQSLKAGRRDTARLSVCCRIGVKPANHDAFVKLLNLPGGVDDGSVNALAELKRKNSALFKAIDATYGASMRRQSPATALSRLFVAPPQPRHAARLTTSAVNAPGPAASDTEGDEEVALATTVATEAATVVWSEDDDAAFSTLKPTDFMTGWPSHENTYNAVVWAGDHRVIQNYPQLHEHLGTTQIQLGSSTCFSLIVLAALHRNSITGTDSWAQEITDRMRSEAVAAVELLLKDAYLANPERDIVWRQSVVDALWYFIEEFWRLWDESSPVGAVRVADPVLSKDAMTVMREWSAKPNDADAPMVAFARRWMMAFHVEEAITMQHQRTRAFDYHVFLAEIKPGAMGADWTPMTFARECFSSCVPHDRLNWEWWAHSSHQRVALLLLRHLRFAALVHVPGVAVDVARYTTLVTGQLALLVRAENAKQIASALAHHGDVPLRLQQLLLRRKFGVTFTAEVARDSLCLSSDQLDQLASRASCSSADTAQLAACISVLASPLNDAVHNGTKPSAGLPFTTIDRSLARHPLMKLSTCDSLEQIMLLAAAIQMTAGRSMQPLLVRCVMRINEAATTRAGASLVLSGTSSLLTSVAKWFKEQPGIAAVPAAETSSVESLWASVAAILNANNDAFLIHAASAYSGNELAGLVVAMAARTGADQATPLDELEWCQLDRSNSDPFPFEALQCTLAQDAVAELKEAFHQCAGPAAITTAETARFIATLQAKSMASDVEKATAFIQMLRYAMGFVHIHRRDCVEGRLVCTHEQCVHTTRSHDDMKKHVDAQHADTATVLHKQNALLHYGKTAFKPKEVDLLPNQILTLLLALTRPDGSRLLNQLGTGQGKSLITRSMAVYYALQGMPVCVFTSQSVLAQRDARDAEPFVAAMAALFERWSLKVGCNVDEAYVTGAKPCYSCSIVYGASEFVFDYLRDRFAGHNTMGGAGSPWKDIDESGAVTYKMSTGVVIADESDFVVIDLARCEARLTTALPGFDEPGYVLALMAMIAGPEEALGETMSEVNIAEDATASGGVYHEILEQHPAMRPLLQRLLRAAEPPAGYCALGSTPQRHFLADFTSERINKQWYDSIEQSFRMGDRVDFVASDDGYGVIQIEASTGLLQKNTKWSDGLHGVIQVRRRQRMVADVPVSNFCSFATFFAKFGRFIGHTGTLGGKEELKVYEALLSQDTNTKFDFAIIPSSHTSRVRSYWCRAHEEQRDWLDDVVSTANEICRQKRAVLVVCRTIADAEFVADACNQRAWAATSIMTNLRATEAEERAFRRPKHGTLLIGTNVASRGTDIDASEVEVMGGLHVLLGYSAPRRQRRQIRGRTGRQGQPGSFQIITLKHRDAVAGIRKGADAAADAFAKQIIDDAALAREADATFERYCDVQKTVLAKVLSLPTGLNKPAKANFAVAAVKSTMETEFALLATRHAIVEKGGALLEKWERASAEWSALSDVPIGVDQAIVLASELLHNKYDCRSPLISRCVDRSMSDAGAAESHMLAGWRELVDLTAMSPDKDRDAVETCFRMSGQLHARELALLVFMREKGCPVGSTHLAQQLEDRENFLSMVISNRRQLERAVNKSRRLVVVDLDVGQPVTCPLSKVMKALPSNTPSRPVTLTFTDRPTINGWVDDYDVLEEMLPAQFQKLELILQDCPREVEVQGATLTGNLVFDNRHPHVVARMLSKGLAKGSKWARLKMFVLNADSIVWRQGLSDYFTWNALCTGDKELSEFETVLEVKGNDAARERFPPRSWGAQSAAIAWLMKRSPDERVRCTVKQCLPDVFNTRARVDVCESQRSVRMEFVPTSHGLSRDDRAAAEQLLRLARIDDVAIQAKLHFAQVPQAVQAVGALTNPSEPRIKIESTSRFAERYKDAVGPAVAQRSASDICQLTARGLILEAGITEIATFSWKRFMTFVLIGVIQIGVGAALIWTGVSAVLGLDLIAEGFGDIVSAGVAGWFKGSMRWGDYRRAKILSVGLVAALGGFSTGSAASAIAKQLVWEAAERSITTFVSYGARQAAVRGFQLFINYLVGVARTSAVEVASLAVRDSVNVCMTVAPTSAEPLRFVSFASLRNLLALRDVVSEGRADPIEIFLKRVAGDFSNVSPVAQKMRQLMATLGHQAAAAAEDPSMNDAATELKERAARAWSPKATNALAETCLQAVATHVGSTTRLSMTHLRKWLQRTFAEVQSTEAASTLLDQAAAQIGLTLDAATAMVRNATSAACSEAMKAILSESAYQGSQKDTALFCKLWQLHTATIDEKEVSRLAEMIKEKVLDGITRVVSQALDDRYVDIARCIVHSFAWHLRCELSSKRAGNSESGPAVAFAMPTSILEARKCANCTLDGAPPQAAA